MCLCVTFCGRISFCLINPKHSISTRKMPDNAGPVILSKTELKYANNLSSLKARIADCIEVVWFPASLYEIMAEKSEKQNWGQESQFTFTHIRVCEHIRYSKILHKLFTNPPNQGCNNCSFYQLWKNEKQILTNKHNRQMCLNFPSNYPLLTFNTKTR